MIGTEPYNFMERIRLDMRSSMAQKDLVKTKALKNLLARFSAAEAVSAPDKNVTNARIAGAAEGVGTTEAPRRNLTVLELKALINEEIDELQQTIDQLDQPSEYRSNLAAQRDILRDYAQ